MCCNCLIFIFLKYEFLKYKCLLDVFDFEDLSKSSWRLIFLINILYKIKRLIIGRGLVVRLNGDFGFLRYGFFDFGKMS